MRVTRCDEPELTDDPGKVVGAKTAKPLATASACGPVGRPAAALPAPLRRAAAS